MDAKFLLAKLRRCRLHGEATKWVNNQMTLQVSKVVINHMKPTDWLVMTGVPQWLILGLILFGVFTWTMWWNA